jgi:hypothetical protein
MRPPTPARANDVDGVDTDWRGPCRVGGLAALVQVACALTTMIVVLTLGGEPGSASEAFELLQGRRTEGLLRLDFASLISMGAFYLTFFGLYAALRRSGGGHAALATALAFVGITLWLSAHPAFSLLYLSDQHAAAATEARRSQLLAAGEAVFAGNVWHSSAAVMAGLLLPAGVMVSVLMRRSGLFGPATAWAGIGAFGIDLAHVVVNAFARGNPADILMAIAGPLYLVWFALVGRRLLQLGQAPPGTAASREGLIS